MTMARETKGELSPAALGWQGCGDKQQGSRGLARRSGRGFAKAVPNQRAARVCTTKRRALRFFFPEDRSSQPQSADSSTSRPAGHRDDESCTFLAPIRPTNVRRSGNDFTRQDAEFLFFFALLENQKQQAPIPACCLSRAGSLKVQPGLWNWHADFLGQDVNRQEPAQDFFHLPSFPLLVPVSPPIDTARQPVQC